VRLDRVHVGVDATIGLELGEARVPGLHDHAGLLVPEVPQRHLERTVQRLPRTRAARRGRARGREDHERDGVRGLAVVGRAARGAAGPPDAWADAAWRWSLAPCGPTWAYQPPCSASAGGPASAASPWSTIDAAPGRPSSTPSENAWIIRQVTHRCTPSSGTTSPSASR